MRRVSERRMFALEGRAVLSSFLCPFYRLVLLPPFLFRACVISIKYDAASSVFYGLIGNLGVTATVKLYIYLVTSMYYDCGNP